MDEHEEVVHDAEVVDEVEVEDVGAPGTALAAPPAGGGGAVATLWNTHDPQEIVAQAGKVATALKDVIDRQSMTTSMGGNRKHVNIEGWQTAGTLLGLQAIVIATHRIEPKSSFEVTAKRKKWGKVDGKRQVIEETENTWTVTGWSFEAIAEVRTMDGRIVGRAEATCSREEDKWFDSDEYAVKSMAQTRACSRALRQALGFIVGMAGYATTPSEEMPSSAAAEPEGLNLPVADEKQRDQLRAALKWLLPQGEGEAVWGAIKSLFGNELYGPVCDAVVAAIGARKALEDSASKD